MKILNKILVGVGSASIIAAVVAPIVVLTQKDSINTNNALNTHSELNKKLPITAQKSSISELISNMNVSNMANNKISSLNKAQILDLINKKVDTLSSNNNYALNDSKILKAKASAIALDILNGKVSILSYLNTLKNKFNALPKNEQNEILSNINKKMQKNDKLKQSALQFNDFFSLSPNSSYASASSDMTGQLIAMATLTTAAAVAATAVAAADWTTAGISWAQVANIKNLYMNIINGTIEGLSITSTINDIMSVPYVMLNLQNYLIRAAATAATDLGVNAATGWADPEAAAWLVPGITAVQISLDIITAVLGLGSLF